MEPLAKIEFTFLEKQKNVRNWDNTFYELFALFHGIESRFSPPCSDVNDRFMMFTSKNIYVKKYQEKKIQVYHNPGGKIENVLQLYLFSAYDEAERKILLQLIEDIQKYLVSIGKEYSIKKGIHFKQTFFSDAKPYLALDF